MRTPTLTIGLATLLATWAGAQVQTRDGSGFDVTQLEQLAAPIALYSDSLLMQVLMASTYPLEVVEADRFARLNVGAANEALQAAIATEAWDPSVKSLVGFPDVLKSMSENLDWTRDLGDAFLSQRNELLDAVQSMRARAREAGTLVTTSQQIVTVKEDGTIVIETANPEVVYVPIYSPLAVYGGWSYRSYHYPRIYRQRPPYARLSYSIGFGRRDWLFGYPIWRRGHSDIYIDHDRFNRFNAWSDRHGNDRNRLPAGQGAGLPWTHQPAHRRGVAYSNGATRGQFGGQAEPHRFPRQEARGFPRAPVPHTVPKGPPAGPENRAPVQPRPGQRSPVPQPHQRQGAQPVPRQLPAQRPTSPRVQGHQGGGVRSSPRSAWSGSRNPGADRGAAHRGSSSRGHGASQGSRGASSGGTRGGELKRGSR